MALFALGLHLGGAGLGLRGTTVEEIWLNAVKRLAFPVAVWLVGKHAFGIHGEWPTYLVLIAAMLAPQNVFILAQRYAVGVGNVRRSSTEEFDRGPAGAAVLDNPCAVGMTVEWRLPRSGHELTR